MIEFFRTKVGRWVAGVIVALLVVAFAFFGVEQFNTTTTSSPVASVGGRDVTILDFQRAFNRRVQALRRQPNLRNLTTQDAVRLGVARSILAELAGDAALLDEADRLGFEASDRNVAAELLRVPAFRNGEGGFNREAYRQFLANQRMRAVDLERDLRNDMTTRILLDAARTGGVFSRSAVERVWKRQAQRRDIAFVTLTETDADKPTDPTDEALKKHHEANKAEFTTPEYRVVELFWIRPEDRADPSSITDEAAKKLYESRLARFTTAERRNLQTLAFTTEDAAKKAAERLKAAKPEARAETFSTIAKEKKIDPTKASIGFVRKSDLALFGSAVADAVFAGEADKVSNTIVGPVKTPAGWSVYRIAGVAPATKKTFDDVKADLKKELAVNAARRAMVGVQTAVEDQRAGGAPLKEIAAKEKGVYKLVKIDKNGLGVDGKPVADLPDRANVLRLIFPTSSDEESKIVGLERNFVRRPDGGFYTVNVKKIEPARLKPLEEAKADVTASWRRAEIQAAMAKRAAELIKRLDAGETLAKAAESLKLKVTTSKGLRRNQPVSGVPSSVLTKLFAADATAGATADAPLDAAASSDVGAAKKLERRVVARLENVVDPTSAAATAEIARVAQQFDNLVANDLQLAMTGALLAAREMSTNESAIRAALGLNAHGGTAR